MIALAAMFQIALSTSDCVAACPAPEGVERINLGVGTQQVLNFAGLLHVAFTGAIDVKCIGPNQLLVIGAKSGEAELRVLTSQGEKRVLFWVRMLDPDSCGWFHPNIYDLLPCSAGFDVLYDEAQGYEVRGTYRDLLDWTKVLAVHVRYGAKIPPPSPALIARVLSDANVALFKAGLEVRVHRLGKGVVLSAADPLTLKKAVEVLGPQRQALVELIAHASSL